MINAATNGFDSELAESKANESKYVHKVAA